MFSCEICKIFKYTFFYRTPPVAAFVNFQWFNLDKTLSFHLYSCMRHVSYSKNKSIKVMLVMQVD